MIASSFRLRSCRTRSADSSLRPALAWRRPPPSAPGRIRRAQQSVASASRRSAGGSESQHVQNQLGVFRIVILGHARAAPGRPAPDRAACSRSMAGNWRSRAFSSEASASLRNLRIGLGVFDHLAQFGQHRGIAQRHRQGLQLRMDAARCRRRAAARTSSAKTAAPALAAALGRPGSALRASAIAGRIAVCLPSVSTTRSTASGVPIRPSSPRGETAAAAESVHRWPVSTPGARPVEQRLQGIPIHVGQVVVAGVVAVRRPARPTCSNAAPAGNRCNARSQVEPHHRRRIAGGQLLQPGERFRLDRPLRIVAVELDGPSRERRGSRRPGICASALRRSRRRRAAPTGRAAAAFRRHFPTRFSSAPRWPPA